MKKLTLSILTVFFTIMISIPAGYADWMDEWIDQKAISGSVSASTSKRDFVGLGSTSLRWRTSNDSLISVSKPSFKMGCGGIDLFMGSFSMLSFDYLVQKMQKIMGSAAPAFAFDIAMSVLSQQASSTIKSLMSIADRLNQLQLDDCKASKALVAVADKGLGLKVAEEKSEEITDFKNSTGISTLYDAVKKMGENTTPDQTLNGSGATVADMYSGCPTILKDYFFTPGSVLKKIGDKKGISESQVNLMRGLVGDVAISSTLDVGPIEACTQNAELKIEDIITGDIKIKENGATACIPMPKLTIDGVDYANTAQYVNTMLKKVAEKMFTKVVYTPDETKFALSLPPIIFKGLMVYTGENGAQNAADQFTGFASAYYVYYMFSNMYADMVAVAESAANAVKAQKGSETGTNQANCKADSARYPAELIASKKDIVYRYSTQLQTQYNAEISKLLASTQVAEAMSKAEREVAEERDRAVGKKEKR